jgi:hypothetical protein
MYLNEYGFFFFFIYIIIIIIIIMIFSVTCAKAQYACRYIVVEMGIVTHFDESIH